MFLACGAARSEPAPAVVPPSLPVVSAVPTSSPVVEPPLQVDDRPLSPTLADSIQLFGRDLHRAVAKANKGNIVYSPLSIALALGMTWAGARGATANEMARVLHHRGDDPSVHAEYGSIVAALASDPVEGAPELRVANRIWVEQTSHVLPEFTALTRDRYRAPLMSLDFINAAKAARTTINSWVSEQTRQRIPELLPEGSLDSETRMVLTNAIYMNAKWADPFRVSDTHDADFYADGTKPTKVRMMGALLSARYAKVKDAEVLELPYVHPKGLELSMVIILPTKRTGIARVEKAYLDSGLSPYMEPLKVEPFIALGLPRFETSGSFELSDILKAMGMPTAFTFQADFSGMHGNETESQAISQVIHKSFLKITEEGTEAAAASAVIKVAETGEIMSQKTIPFRVDHPFLFVIRDVRSGVVLFAGRVTTVG